MDLFRIQGNGPLAGTVDVSGAKNAALPAMAASFLTEEPVVLKRLPKVWDVFTLIKLLKAMGKEVHWRDNDLVLSGSVTDPIAPYELVRKMRASILILGPVLARFGEVSVSQPGGCNIGQRPIDLHLSALEQMGASIVHEHGYIRAKASRLRSKEILFDKVTVTGCENILMAACLADGETTIHNAAREPEIVDLAQMLRGMGAIIEGEGSDRIWIQGVSSLHGTEHTIIADRIEAGTLLCAAAITRGHVTVSHFQPDHLAKVLSVLERMGVPLKHGVSSVEVLPHEGLKPLDIVTKPHPGFPTDMQAQVMVLLSQAAGRSMVTENIFENRFMHVMELNRMGCDIRTEGRNALVQGPVVLEGAEVMASDLRASACLVLAALVAQGETVVRRIYHLDRGYERLEEKLNALGARIQRMVE
jgi:UDP-N-acetylglucosamine 1-carboxyvinyltransferase